MVNRGVYWLYKSSKDSEFPPTNGLTYKESTPEALYSAVMYSKVRADEEVLAALTGEMMANDVKAKTKVSKTNVNFLFKTFHSSIFLSFFPIITFFTKNVYIVL